jgi:hypothetical protein
MDPVLQAAVATLWSAIMTVVVNKSAEKGVEVAIDRANWSEKLRQELEKARSLEREEHRWAAYGHARVYAVHDPVGRRSEPQHSANSNGSV